MKAKITLLPGDGIGPEVTESAKHILNSIASIFDHEFIYDTQPIGGIAIDQHGNPLPDNTISSCKNADAVVSLAGPPAGAEKSVMPEAIRNTVTAMREHSVKRLIVQTGGFVKLKGEKSSVLESGAREAFSWMMKEKATLAGNDELALFLPQASAMVPLIQWRRPSRVSSSHFSCSSVAPPNNFLAYSGSLSPNLIAVVNPSMVPNSFTNIGSASGPVTCG